jgi:hypothetical protein
MIFKKVIIIILTVISVLFTVNNTIYGSEPNKYYNVYFDSTLLYSYGTAMKASSSSSNWDSDLKSNSTSYIIQISYGTIFNYIYFDDCSFSKFGALLDYSYLDYKMGDIQSLNIGIDCKILWLIKLQLGIGQSFSKQTYIINHGLNMSIDTKEDQVIFNGYSITYSIGLKIPISKYLSIMLYKRNDSYSEGPFLSIGNINLTKNSICFGLKMILWSD